MDKEKAPMLKNLEDRKIKEIEHSRKRREVLQGFERLADTHVAEQVGNLEELVKDKEKFNYYFSNMKYYAITKKSEDYKHKWLENNCNRGIKILDFACGSGENGIYAATFGADCIGIDISPEGVNNANKNATGTTHHSLMEFGLSSSLTWFVSLTTIALAIGIEIVEEEASRILLNDVTIAVFGAGFVKGGRDSGNRHQGFPVFVWSQAS